MAEYHITQPVPGVIRVEFPSSWNAEAQSGLMFHDLLARLNEFDEKVTLVIVAGNQRPVYTEIGAARDILFHDCLRRIVIVAEGAQGAVAHMSAARGERGLPPIPISAFANEEAANAALLELKA